MFSLLTTLLQRRGSTSSGFFLFSFFHVLQVLWIRFVDVPEFEHLWRIDIAFLQLTATSGMLV